MPTTRWYLTTAIPFVNGAPHLGHALEYVQTDVLERVAEMGRPVDERDRGGEIPTSGGHRLLLARPSRAGTEPIRRIPRAAGPGRVRVRTPRRGPSFVRAR